MSSHSDFHYSTKKRPKASEKFPRARKNRKIGGFFQKNVGISPENGEKSAKISAKTEKFFRSPRSNARPALPPSGGAGQDDGSAVPVVDRIKSPEGGILSQPQNRLRARQGRFVEFHARIDSVRLVERSRM